MEFILSKDRQAVIINNLIEACEGDIFRLALTLNIVPESLDLDWRPPEGHSYQQNDLDGLLYELNRLKALKTRLSALG